MLQHFPFSFPQGKRLESREVDLDQAMAHVKDMQARVEALRALLPPPLGEPVLRYARTCIDSATTRVTDAQLQAFQRVEALRYGVFMPPPA